MNSLMVLVTMGMCLLWMISLIDYQSYQTLTTHVLVQTTQDEYEREGLFVYAQAYYEKHKKSLTLPALVPIQELMKYSQEQISLSVDRKGDVLLMRIILKGSVHEKRLLLKKF